MSSELFNSLADLVNTTDDLRTIQKEVELIKESVYSTGKKGMSNVLHEQVRAKVAKIIEPALTEKPAHTLDELATELQALPIIRMNIAFQPTQSTIEKITGWLRSNTEQKWILDLVINPEVGAGTVIEVNGYYRDYSLKQKMTQAVEAATKNMMKTL
ncbi:hypothetical protein BH10PAT2_BH10PAT2_4280 [soil metagenome]